MQQQPDCAWLHSSWIWEHFPASTMSTAGIIPVWSRSPLYPVEYLAFDFHHAGRLLLVAGHTAFGMLPNWRLGSILWLYLFIILSAYLFALSLPPPHPIIFFSCFCHSSLLFCLSTSYVTYVLCTVALTVLFYFCIYFFSFYSYLFICCVVNWQVLLVGCCCNYNICSFTYFFALFSCFFLYSLSTYTTNNNKIKDKHNINIIKYIIIAFYHFILLLWMNLLTFFVYYSHLYAIFGIFCTFLL